MKTKFTSREIIDFYHFVTDVADRGEEIDPELLEELLEEVYESSHFPMWWKLDIPEKNLYIIKDEPLYFNIGDLIIVGYQQYTILKKSINLTEEYIEYTVV